MLASYAAGETGARAAARAGASVVVVDAYRASTTIAVLVSKGARVLPVASIEEAAAAKSDYRVGERGSAKVKGFDCGNSRTGIQAGDIGSGATVALSTTNGTRIVQAARDARAFLPGAFGNGHALSAHPPAVERGSRVVIVGCGWEGRRASEDESAAGAILTRLRERSASLDERAERVVDLYRRRSERSLRNNSAARRLKRLHYEQDLDFCLALNAVPVSPRLLDGVFVGSER